MSRLALLVLVLLTACAAPPGGGDDALTPAAPASEDGDVTAAGSGCAVEESAPSGPLVLQAFQADAPGPFYAVRTDGPCRLVVTFTGSPEGTGGCEVAEYRATVELSDGEQRLRVRPAEEDGRSGSGDCPSIGASRTAVAELAEPLRLDLPLLDAGTSRPVHLVDGSQLLQAGDLPEGWEEQGDGEAAGTGVAWETRFGVPGGTAWLRQGDVSVGVPSGTHLFGYRELDRPRVRGVEGVLGSFTQEAPGNHVLHWVEGDRGYVLQLMGPLPDPTALVQVADALE